jgi:NhaP-type Na+/H+ or K+/H+ antiporter
MDNFIQRVMIGIVLVSIVMSALIGLNGDDLSSNPDLVRNILYSAGGGLASGLIIAAVVAIPLYIIGALLGFKSR